MQAEQQTQAGLPVWTAGNLPLQIKKPRVDGVVEFTVALKTLNLSQQQLRELEQDPGHYLANTLGEILLRSHLHQFNKLLKEKHYAKLCRAYAHRSFVFRRQGPRACFYFHLSLLHQCINDQLQREMRADPPQKPGRCPASLTPLIYRAAPKENAAEQTPAAGASILEIATDYFRTRQWVFLARRNNIIFMHSRGRHGIYFSQALIREKKRRFIFCTRSAIHAPPEKHAAVVEYLTRANYGLYSGRWEFDYSDGEITFSHSLDAKDSPLTKALIHNLVQSNLFTFDYYYPGLMEVIYQNAAPEAVIRKLETS